MENHHAIHGKLTVSVAIFNSYVTNYQSVKWLGKLLSHFHVYFHWQLSEVGTNHRSK